MVEKAIKKNFQGVGIMKERIESTNPAPPPHFIEGSSKTNPEANVAHAILNKIMLIPKL